MTGKMKDAIELLSASTAKKRESGAKRLGKIADPEAGAFLLDALEKEIEDSKTWSCQYQLILALGFCRYEPALPFLLKLKERSFDSAILYIGLGDAILRLSILNNTIKDSLSVIFESKDYLIMQGAFTAMALLKLLPEDDDIKKIIEIALDPKITEIVKGHPKDSTGVRKWVATAAAGWKDELRIDFLYDCLKIDDAHVKMAVEDALKNKYVNWKPY